MFYLLQNIAERNMEMAAWQDLATVYTKFGSWPDAEICLNKAKSIEFYSPKSWHTTGKNPIQIYNHCILVNDAPF